MSAPPIPLTPAQHARARIARAVRFAQISAGTMLGLGGLSALFSILHPLSAAFFISIAVVVNGTIEWRQARRLAAFDTRAPAHMAINQLALGVEIAAYSTWQAVQMTPDAVRSVLRLPLVAAFLKSLPQADVATLYDLLPPMFRMMYVAVGAGALVGCVATAAYFWSRRKYLVAR